MFENARRRIVRTLAADIIAEQTEQISDLSAEVAKLKKVVAAPITHDQEGWTVLSQDAATEDRPFSEWQRDVADALAAWRKNFLARRIVTLTTNYVVGDKITITSDIPDVQEFIQEWWNHPLNQMDLRLGKMCDALTISGEIYPVLFPHPVTKGLSYIRFIPARQIDQIETDPHDIEHELAYHRQPNAFELRGHWWRTKHSRTNDEPFMLHYAINQAIGGSRGEGDLVPVLPWLKRYTAWLQDRVRLNKARTESAAWLITIKDPEELQTKQKQYEKKEIRHGSKIVKGPDEDWQAIKLNIDAHAARDDGKNLRLAVASGVGFPLHYFAEGESATKGTAGEMNAPTFRHFRTRQQNFLGFCKDIVKEAYSISNRAPHDDLQLKATTPDIEPQDNKLLAEAARTIVEALSDMKAEGWITNEIAIRIAFKFAGELLTEKEIKTILGQED